MTTDFVYNPELQLLICTICETGIKPTLSAQKRHLYHAPHFIAGQELVALIELFSSYTLKPLEDLKAPTTIVPAIAGLRLHRAFCCSCCQTFEPTVSKSFLHAHISKEHHIKPQHQEVEVHWSEQSVQTYFRETLHQCYFKVSEHGDLVADTAMSLTTAQFFASIDEDLMKIESDAIEASSTVQGFGIHKSEVIPWLDTRTGIAAHLYGLPHAKIQHVIRLPVIGDPMVPRILFDLVDITHQALDEAFAYCEEGPNCQLSYAVQLVLSQFYDEGPASGGAQRAFNSKKTPGTKAIYYGYLKRFIVYCYWIIEHGQDVWFPDGNKPEGVRVPSEGIIVSDAQWAQWNSLMRYLKPGPTNEDIGGKKMAQHEIWRFFHSMICFRTYGNKYCSALVSFTAMLAMRPTTTLWKEPGDFNSCLSGIIWVSQLIILRAAVDSAKDAVSGPPVAGLSLIALPTTVPEMPPAATEPAQQHIRNQCAETSVLYWVKQYCQEYLQQNTETAMGELLSWRLLLFKVSLTSAKKREAFWSEDGLVITYDDTALHMSNVTSLLLSEYQIAYRLLFTDLMFSSTTLPRLQPHALDDQITSRNSDEYFAAFNKMKINVRGLVDEIKGSPKLQQAFLLVTDGGESQWSEKAIDVYEALVQSFLQRLLVLIHISGGQPLRSGEILSVKWKNTTHQSRNIFIHQKRVMIHTNYHKGMEQTGAVKDNIRYIPAPVGELLVNYLCYVQTLRQVFLRLKDKSAILPAHLWSSKKGVWDDARLTSSLMEATAIAKLPSLHTSNWRQITVGIVKKKFGDSLDCFNLATDGVDVAATDASDLGIMNRQRNHTSHTANISYANQVSHGGVWDEMLSNGLKASLMWQGFFEMESSLQQHAKRSRSTSMANNSSLPLIKKIALGRRKKFLVWKKAQLLIEAKRVFRDSEFRWRTSSQGSAVELVTSRSEVVVVVAPTGYGKSVLFMLPCMLPDAGTTVLVLPLISLRSDMVRRLKALEINHIIWSPGNVDKAPLVLVSVEAASSKEFMAYCQRLIQTQDLDRIVIDECHLTITASSYRTSMIDLANMRKLSTQFVYLSATLPPSMIDKFYKQNHIINPRTITVCVDRASINYEIHKDQTPGLLVPKSVRLIRSMHEMDLAHGSFAPEDKVIIYCRSLLTTKSVAEMMECSAYTSDAGSESEKENIINEWLRNPTKPWIVATSALGAGFDYPHIRRVWHIDGPKSMIDYAQESGRAGRDGRPATASIVLQDQYDTRVPLSVQYQASPSRSPVLPHQGWDEDGGAMHQYLVTRNCLRWCLSRFLDGVNTTILRCNEDNQVRCGNCRARTNRGGVNPDRFDTSTPPDQPKFSGPEVYAQRLRDNESVLRRMNEDLVILKDTCLLCRGRGRASFDHIFSRCPFRFSFFEAKKRRAQLYKGKWFKPFTACFTCSLPEVICPQLEDSVATTISSHSPALPNSIKHCAFPDLVMPLCWAMWEQDPEQQTWFEERLGLKWEDASRYLHWLGQPCLFAGCKSINAMTIFSHALIALELTSVPSTMPSSSFAMT